MLTGKRVVVTGGTGSLGQTLVRRLLAGNDGPESVTVFSRDEAKQHAMRVDIPDDRLQFRIGNVRDFHSVAGVLRNADVVFNVAALKQVPSCEYHPTEAVATNIGGPENIVNAIRDLGLSVETVVFVSTDKAAKPVNVMGMTKAIQERLFIQANLECDTRFVGVRYGNVLASRGSVIPLFHQQIRSGGPVTITTPDMTRFLLTLDMAVDTVLASLRGARRGEIYVPRVPSARITDVAGVLVGDRPIDIKITGIRPGEKTHEILISEEEASRAVQRGPYYAIAAALPELAKQNPNDMLFRNTEFCSADELMDIDSIERLLLSNKMMVDDDLH